MDIWNSDALKKIISPDREEFKNTLCYDCDEFDDCIRRKGVCYARTLILDQNRLFNIDPICPKFTKKIKFV